MRLLGSGLAVLVAIPAILTGGAEPGPPAVFRPGEVWADTDGTPINAHGGGVLFHGGTYYWYGEIKTGKFVMWMHVDSEDYKLAHAGVAVADSPAGPFRYLGSLRPDGAMSRDMTLFADDDGKAYLFHSSEDNATMHVARLTDDYLKPSGRFERIFVGRYMEAPAVVKRKGRYYLMASGCTGWAPNPARSAVADSVFGPWKELGNPCRGPGSEITFRCQSTYILPVAGKPDAFICMLDRWSQFDLPDSRYVWLPLRFEREGFVVEWRDAWGLEDL